MRDQTSSNRLSRATTSSLPALSPAAVRPDATPLALSVSDAAKIAGVSRSTLYAEMAAGKLTYSKIGKRRLILVESLLDWLRAATEFV
jgi:excisionase family DNA binding protein